MNNNQNILAKANASKLIVKYCYKSPNEMNIEELLYAENLVLKEEILSDCEGKILFDEEIGIITINSRINDIKQKRFTIAHEMGHFFNERGNGKGSYRCGFNEFYGLLRNNERESNANYFAAELLMYEKWFIDFIKGKKINKKIMIDTANYFNVSLSAAAIRYSEIGTEPIAVIMSKDSIIKWVSINEKFKIHFIRCNVSVSELSYAFDYFKGDPIPAEPEDVPARAWFNESFYIKDSDRVNEFHIPFPNYNSLLTILYFD